MKKIVALVLAMVMVLGLATTAFAAKAGYDFDQAKKDQYWDYVIEADDTEDAKDKTFATYEIEAVALKDGAKMWFASPSDLTAMEDDDFDLGTFVKADANNATFVLVDGKNISYYMAIGNELKWDATAVAFTLPAKPADKGDVTCDTMYTKKPVDSTYYFDAKEFVIYESAVNGPVTLNVGGVAINAKIADSTEYVGHDYVVTWADRTMNNSNYPTKVYCESCKAEFAFVYGYEEDALAKWGVNGYKKVYDVTGSLVDVYIESTLPVNHPALSAVPSVPSVDGDKVESPKTFDAGIAMYVGMSVMAAAGSAVVLKKKD